MSLFTMMRSVFQPHFFGATGMPRVNRREIVADGEIQVFHVVNRCVRRTHLCGRDRQSRKGLIQVPCT